MNKTLHSISQVFERGASSSVARQLRFVCFHTG